MSTSSSSLRLRVGVLGAGAIGGYVGGCLAAGGQAQVTLVGRASLAESLAREGVTLSCLDQAPRTLALGEALQVSTDVADLAGCDVVLLCTKGRDTTAAAESLRPHLAPGAAVVSLQNGVRNATRIREALPDPGVAVLRGMVSFNVVWTGGHFHQGTSGPLLVDPLPASTRLLAAMQAGGLDAAAHPDMEGILWGKLLFNLNNAVNALAGLPLREQLEQRPYRRLMAAIIAEAQGVLRAAGVRPRALGKMNPTLARLVLPLPDALFFRVASTMLQVDRTARSSMQDDLRRGRLTEIADLNGEIVARGAAPLNARVVALIQAAEVAGRGSPGLSAEEIRGTR